MDKPDLIARGWKQLKELGIFLAAVLALYIFADWQKEQVVKDVRAEINGAYTGLCLGSQANPFYPKYNGLIDILITDLEKRREENLAKGDAMKAAINQETIINLGATKFTVVRVDCSKPLLGGR